MKITYYYRKPIHIHYSIEMIFSTVCENLSKPFQVVKFEAPYVSKGILNRLRITFQARRFQSDINHITGDIHFIALGLKKKKTILTIHDLGILNNTSNPLAKWILKTFWISLPIRFVSAVTVVSEATKNELIKVTGINPLKVHVIGNFITNDFTYSPKSFNTSEPRILHIGSAYNKNLDRLIESLSSVSCYLVIIGYPTDQQRKALKEHHIKHEVLSGLSNSELIEQYRQCDILSFISLLEGFGLPILEAQATGRPVITSNLSSMPEVAGQGACLVDPYDTNAIKEGILKIINNEAYRDQLIAHGLENVKRFNPLVVAKQYEELYLKIYNQNNPQ